jgi:hypothetical protein
MLPLCLRLGLKFQMENWTLCSEITARFSSKWILSHTLAMYWFQVCRHMWIKMEFQNNIFCKKTIYKRAHLFYTSNEHMQQLQNYKTTKYKQELYCVLLPNGRDFIIQWIVLLMTTLNSLLHSL